MKKRLFLIISLLLFLTGCDLFKDDFSDKYVYTTYYPIEYATRSLYSDYGNISSLYPNGASKNYKLTEKKKKTYSNAELFIYSGVANEASLAKDLINMNSKMKLIDATKGMNNLELQSTWLDPSNYLMLCSNIKSNLIEYNDNVYVKEAIENNYKELNKNISEIDVQLYDIGKNGNYNTLLVTNDIFNYLTKYNINIISLDPDNEQIDKAYADAKKLIREKKIQYFFILKGMKLMLIKKN